MSADRIAWIALGAWAVMVVVHGWLRSLGAAAPDPIRDSGPYHPA